MRYFAFVFVCFTFALNAQAKISPDKIKTILNAISEAKLVKQSVTVQSAFSCVYRFDVLPNYGELFRNHRSHLIQGLEPDHVVASLQREWLISLAYPQPHYGYIIKMWEWYRTETNQDVKEVLSVFLLNHYHKDTYTEYTTQSASVSYGVHVTSMKSFLVNDMQWGATDILSILKTDASVTQEDRKFEDMTFRAHSLSWDENKLGSSPNSSMSVNLDPPKSARKLYNGGIFLNCSMPGF